jgi:hypothetical protein
VEQRCTCGAILPEEARFCHKCGKPQYEEDIARLAQEEQPSPPAASSVPPVGASPAPGISFKNSRAVSISAAVAAAAFFGSGIAGMVSPLLWPLILLASGFFAAGIYKGRSSEPLSGIAGARLGWMTGLWLFLVITIVGIIISFYLASPAGADVIRQLKAMPQFSQLNIGDTHELLSSMLVSAIPTFFMVTAIPGLGGLLGARFWTKSKPTS